MTVTLQQVSIPPWSTIGFGFGVDQDGRRVGFVGDHRPLCQLGDALTRATEPILVEVEPWQVITVEEADG